MLTLVRPPVIAALAAGLAALALLAPAPARAEKADRSKPMVVEADREGSMDLQRQVLVYSGNVVISQGTIRELLPAGASVPVAITSVP